jgi:small subunit ribosomal protein S8e
MALWQGVRGRKVRKRKRKFQMGREHTETLVGERRAKRIRAMGGAVKTRLYAEMYANVYDPKNKKSKKVKILSVIENRANPHYVRRNIITRGAIVETELGKVRVTSRPGQSGTVNAVLI